MIEQQFLEMMMSHGFQPGQIIADGKYHRFPIKSNDRNGYYNLDSDGHGVFGNWKTGDQYKFRFGKSELMTEDERRDVLARNKAIRRAQDAQKKNAEARAAELSNKIWNRSLPVSKDHWYIVDKKIETHNAKIDATGALIFPIYDGDKIVNLQKIFPEGKRFVLDAKKKGCYGVIEGKSDIVFIAEGFATAASINEATGQTCIIALDAGNLLSVSKNIREKFGVDQKIVIAADNDQYTEVKGEKHNTGMIAARQAASSIYADIVYPDFEYNEENKLTDWNDYVCHFGLSDARNKLMHGSSDLKIVPNKKKNFIENYCEPLDLDENGKPINNIENLKRICDFKNVVLRYNVIKKQEEILIPNESYSLDNFQNASYAKVLSFCKSMDMSTNHIGDYLTYLCDQTQFNPVTTWIKSKVWDGNSRLTEFFDTINCPNKELRDLILTRWMVSAVAAAFSPNGLSTRGVLVFQSAQYVGKTSWFKKLVPQELDVRKDGYILRLDDKDNIFQCLSHWLIELGELDATFRKSDIAQLKAFIPMDRDIMRRPYARKDSNYGRRTVFFASVNESAFLADETGNTRFWTLKVESINYSHNIDMQQVWAEIYNLYLEGEPYIMSAEEIKLVNENNEDFLSADYHEELVSRRLDWDSLAYTDGVWKTATELCNLFNIQNPKKQDLNNISKWVKKYNGEKFKRGSGGVRLLLVPHERTYTHE